MIDPHGEYSAAFKGHGELFNVDNLAMPYWLMNFEEHCEVFVTSPGRRAPARHGHPRQMPAAGARQEPRRRRAFQAHRRFAHPLHALGPHQRDHPRNGPAQQGDRHRAVHAAQDQDRRAEVRSALPVHVLRHARRRHDGPFHLQDLPPAGQGQADLDHRRLGRALRHRLGGGRGALAAGLRLCDLVAQRGAAPRPARLRGGAPLHPVRQDLDRPGGAQDPRADRQGRPQIWRVAGPDHAAPVRSRRGRALAMRHDHRDAPQQRPRPGLREDRRCRKARAASSTSSRRSRNRECIVCGEGVSIPIRVSFDDLERDRCPASSDPLFSMLWKQTGEEEAMVARVVKRWRAQGR